jgi:hypothetical protein
MCTIQCSMLEDPLDRFRDVQVRAARGSEEGHDAVGEEPQDEVGCVVPGQVIPDQQHPEGWRIARQGDPNGQPVLSPFPATSILLSWQHLWLRKGSQDGRQFGFQPGMEDGVGATPHSLDPHLAAGGMEQSQLFGRSVADVLVGIPHRMTGGVPVGTRVGHRLVGSCLVFRVNQNPVVIERLTFPWRMTEASGQVEFVPRLRSVLDPDPSVR